MKNAKGLLLLFIMIFHFPVVYSHPDQDSVFKKQARYQWESRHYVSHHLTEGVLNIETDHGLVQIIPYTSKLIEVKHFESNFPEKDSSVAVILKPEMKTLNVKEEPLRLLLVTPDVTVVVNKDPFNVKFVFRGDTLLAEERGFFKRTNEQSGLRFKMAKEEKFFGLGERAIDFSLRGKKYQLYNQANYGYVLGAEYLNYSVPLVVSSKRYLLFFDNPGRGYVDLGKEEKDVAEWGAVAGLMKYFFVAGDDFKDLSFQWGKLTGTQPLPPRWAMGNLMSRMAYENQDQVEKTVRLMKKKGFPVDAVILDFYWFGDSIKGYVGRLDWFKPRWPDPEKMIADFKKQGIKTVLITEPYVIDSLKNFKIGDSLGIFTIDSAGKTYINDKFYFGPAGLIDIFKPEATEWFWSHYLRLIRQGVAGWWGDLGEPEYHPSDEFHVIGSDTLSADEVHNIYAHRWHKMIFEGYQKSFPGERLFNLNRAGYAGSQRYSIFPWTGDVSRSWGGYQAQIPALLHMSLSGLPYVHSDAGGFAGGEGDEELYVRWMQFACFTPVLRAHADAGTQPPEPVFYSDKTQQIVRKYINLRYRLMPYFYSTAAQSALKGYPLMRPLFYEFPDDWEAFEKTDEYMLGDNILVAPVLQKGQKIRTVYLPRGTKWFDFHSNKRYPGGNEYDLSVSLDKMPLFVKAGSFLPMVEAVNNLELYSDEKLTVRYYVGSDDHRDVYLMYADDGKDPQSIDQGRFETLMFVQKKNEKGRLEMMFSKIKDYAGAPLKRTVHLEIVGLSKNKPLRFALNGQVMKKKKPDGKDQGYFYDEKKKVWSIDFVWDVPDVFVTEVE